MTANTTSDKSSSPNKHLYIPQWINEEYFRAILERTVPSFARIQNFATIAATAPGDNYTSIMVRISIGIELKEGNTKELSYILKTSFENVDQSTALLQSLNLFPKEKYMYENILPQFVKLYKESGVDIQFGPKCVHVEETPEKITLVMEDLKRKHFVNADRLNGFDMSHMRCVLQKLAEFHAASAMYHELNGDYPDMFQNGFYIESNRPVFNAMAESRLKLFGKAMLEWGLENIEHYVQILPSPNDGYSEVIRLNVADTNEFNVLTHGDCWANNIMFNYKDDGAVDETIFVDFQVCKWGSPALDLWYMIITSASLDIKVEEFDHFLCIYHRHLLKCLQLLKYPKKRPTLKDLHMMMLKCGYWGVTTSHGVLCAVLLPSDKDANMDSFIQNSPEADEFKYKTFTNPYYTRAMCQLYPFFEYKGLFDIPKKST